MLIAIKREKERGNAALYQGMYSHALFLDTSRKEG